jgi:polyphosphate glucokinase
LSIDIGGTGIKMMVLDAAGKPLNRHARELTPKPAHPPAVLAVIESMLERQPPFERVSVGFPGVVQNGITRNAPNLDNPSWTDFPLERRLRALVHRPVRVINDADLLGYAVVRGRGLEMVITLGTGMGTALFLDGKLVPNLELGHHPLHQGKTYEDRISDAVLKRIGKKRWVKRVWKAIQRLEPTFNYDALYVGGGNARLLGNELPPKVELFDNAKGLQGGIRLWAKSGTR